MHVDGRSVNNKDNRSYTTRDKRRTKITREIIKNNYEINELDRSMIMDKTLGW